MTSMLNFLQYLAAFVLVLAPLVFIHELGHFLAAKMFRIGVPVFSLGFGPRLFGFRRAETDYRVSLVPLGGYVRLAGDEADEHRTGGPEEFLSRPKYQRFVVFVAGATFNIILAFFAMWLFFGLYGKEAPADYPMISAVEEGSYAETAGLKRGDRLVAVSGKDLREYEFLEVYNLEILLAPETERELVVDRDGERITTVLNTGSDPKYRHGAPGWSFDFWGTPRIIEVQPDRPAEAAGLQPEDRVLSIQGREPVNRTEFEQMIAESPGVPLELKVQREGGTRTLTVTPEEVDGKGRIGVVFGSDPRPRVALSVGESAEEALIELREKSVTLFVVLKRLVTREISVRTMSGPVGIAQVARSALISGMDMFIYLLAFFSLQLGILNLLPIPVLDGGHILILLVEGVMRRELSETVKERVMQAGFVFLLAFMVMIIVLDVVKIAT